MLNKLLSEIKYLTDFLALILFPSMTLLVIPASMILHSTYKNQVHSQPKHQHTPNPQSSNPSPVQRNNTLRGHHPIHRLYRASHPHRRYCRFAESPKHTEPPNRTAKSVTEPQTQSDGMELAPQTSRTHWHCLNGHAQIQRAELKALLIDSCGHS